MGPRLFLWEPMGKLRPRMGIALCIMLIWIEAEPGLEPRPLEPQLEAFCTASFPPPQASGPVGVIERVVGSHAGWSLPHTRPQPGSGSLPGAVLRPHFCPGDYRAVGSVWGPDRPSQALLRDWVPDLTVVGAAQILSQKLPRP